ncbi:MAG: DUF3868 domain-containing protein [Tannerellaceae bacterium]|jgi:outer membrane protein OmpA-like peptidoglycan-associated protein|nr:DUF3868 domain-containing protein [Tannerellaceae bacterium]
MKTFYVYAAIAFLSANSLPGKAQQIFNGQINVPCELKLEDNSLILTMDIDLKKLKINKDRTLTLTPILVGDEKTVEFPPVLINGKKRHKAYEKAVARGEEDTFSEVEPYAVVTPGKKANTVYYTYEVPYEKWMDRANLDMEEELCGCGKFSPELIVERLVDWASEEEYAEEEEEPAYEITPVVAYVQPKADAQKQGSEQWEAFLDFPSAKTAILPDYGNNPEELGKLRNRLNTIKNDPSLSVTLIEITGYASPDGRFDANDRLARARAQALAEYLSSNLTFPEEVYQVKWGGEDWRGLLKMVERSDISPKNQLMSIIKFTPPEKRKQQLMSWAGGVPYRIMERQFFPRLRRVVCRIEYTGSQPEGNKASNLNLAADALKAKDVERAEKYLELAEDDSPEYTNNLGVLFLLHEDYATARKMFTQAAKQGLEAARQNLELLDGLE